jgi:hypothetical protein
LLFLHVHLTYKALFEMSSNRVEFVSRLFTRTGPAGLTTKATANELMTTYLPSGRGDETSLRSSRALYFC